MSDETNAAINVDAKRTESVKRTSSVCLPWLVAMCVMIALIWGNSMVPGGDSGSFSQSVTDFLRGGLSALGLPSDWLTNHVVRKAAHFTEYMCLGIVGMQALRPHRARSGHRAVVALTLALVLVVTPLLDESIQLIAADRGSQVSDVLLDCCGAATGAALTLVASRLFGALRAKR